MPPPWAVPAPRWTTSPLIYVEGPLPPDPVYRGGIIANFPYDGPDLTRRDRPARPFGPQLQDRSGTSGGLG